MLSTADVRDWLAPLIEGQQVEITTDGYVPDKPDRLVVLTIMGGGPPINEGLFERPTLQVRVRGNQRDPDDAEALAKAVDDALIETVPAGLIGGRQVRLIWYLGGPPVYAGTDPAFRREFICNYTVDVARQAN